MSVNDLYSYLGEFASPQKLLDGVISFLLAAKIQNILLPLKIIFLLFSLFFLAFIVFALFKTSWLRFALLGDLSQFFTHRPYGVKRLTKTWLKVAARLAGASESEYKLAVIEADNLLDDTLKRMGFTGESLEQKLKQLTAATLPNVEQVLEAHQIRNSVIHDPDYRLTLDQAKKALAIYEDAFRDLEVL